MKLKTNKNFRPLFFFMKNRKLTSYLSIVLILAVLNLFVGCSYYSVRDVTTSPDTIAQQLEDFKATQKYVVIHSGENIWHLNDFVLNEDQKTISGIVQTVNKQHKPRKPREIKRVHKYYTSKQEPFNEVHFNLGTSRVPEYGSQITIPFSEITSISINDKNSGRVIVNVILGTIGVFVALGIIVLATKSSCPFVYIKNGEEYLFKGELYPGIITANLQSDDYLPLSGIKAENNVYNIRITNELKEIQHTDFLQLIAADHSKNVEVLVDSHGNLHTTSVIIGPRGVLVDNSLNSIEPALHKDNNIYAFDTFLEDDSSTRKIVLEYDKPLKTNRAKLALRVKNSLWLDYVFGKFNEQFGSYYPKFQKDQQSVSKEESLKWINEQHIPLSVYVRTTNGWELVDRINAVGPMASREMVIPIDVRNILGDKLQIKLETGFMFWEVDYAGIDYSENEPIQLHYIDANQALNGTNDDVTKLISKADGKYFTQPNIGDEVFVTFKASEIPNDLNRSVFLKNRGYYNYIRDYKGEPDFEKLKLFRKAGAFTQFSKYEFEALMDYSHHLDIALTDEK